MPASRIGHWKNLEVFSIFDHMNTSERLRFRAPSFRAIADELAAPARAPKSPSFSPALGSQGRRESGLMKTCIVTSAASRRIRRHPFPLFRRGVRVGLMKTCIVTSVGFPPHSLLPSPP